MKARFRTVLILLISLQSLYSTGIGQFDQNISYRIQGNNRHKYQDIFFESISLGTPFLEFGNAFNWYQSGNREVATALAATLVITQLPVIVAKYSIQRPRPRRIYQPHFWNTRITPSFPSGHVASSAAYASFLSHFYPGALPLLIGYAGLSAYSQVYVGNHFVGDVFAGWITGWIVGSLIYSGLNKSVRHTFNTAPPPLIKITLSF